MLKIGYLVDVHGIQIVILVAWVRSVSARLLASVAIDAEEDYANDSQSKSSHL